MNYFYISYKRNKEKMNKFVCERTDYFSLDYICLFKCNIILGFYIDLRSEVIRISRRSVFNKYK